MLVLLDLVRVSAASCPAQPDDAPLVHGGDLADAARGGDERAAVGAFLPEFSRFDFGIDGSPSSIPWGSPGLEILPADHFSVLLRSWS